MNHQYELNPADRDASASLTRYYFGFTRLDDSLLWRWARFGAGVTAYSESDALTLLAAAARQAFGVPLELPPVAYVLVDFDWSKLNPDIQKAAGDSSQRGVWFPPLDYGRWMLVLPEQVAALQAELDRYTGHVSIRQAISQKDHS